MDVELREITSETVRAICELEVAANQRSFVAPNALSIAEAHFTPGHWMRAIYADGQPVGFVLTFDEPSEGYFLWRFMIAEAHQRHGIGRRAMAQVLEHWRELGVTAARTSVVPSNIGATRLYESLGFRLTGEEDDGELVMVWTCDQPKVACSTSSGLIRQRSAGGNPARLMSLPPGCARLRNRA